MSSKCCRSGVRAREGGQGHALSGARWGRVPLPRRSAHPDTAVLGQEDCARSRSSTVWVSVCVVTLGLWRSVRRGVFRSETCAVSVRVRPRAHSSPDFAHFSRTQTDTEYSSRTCVPRGGRVTYVSVSLRGSRVIRSFAHIPQVVVG